MIAIQQELMLHLEEDMLLKAGLNVKVVLFPTGEDPDSYAHQLSNEDFKSIFIRKSD